MATTYTQDDHKTRAVDLVHINPSMLEGERLYTSILGPDRSVRIDRYAPININAPTISGPSEIPGTLVCFPGVWDASPQPSYSYQWLADGVELIGETESSLATYATLDSQEITCEVTATNNEGSVTLESPVGIVVTIIEPINIWEQDYYSVQGLNQLNQQNLMVYRNMVATGMWVENRFDMMTAVSMAVTGLQIPDSQMLYENDVYAITLPSFLESATVVNPGAETGDLTGWTVLGGNPIIGLSGGNTGTYFFSGDPNSSTQIVMYQDVPIGAANHADVDAGLMAAGASLFAGSSSAYDWVEATIQFIGDSGSLGGQVVIIPNQTTPPQNAWRKFSSPAEDIPVGARFIRVTVTLTNHILTGIATRFDDVSVDLYKY